MTGGQTMGGCMDLGAVAPEMVLASARRSWKVRQGCGRAVEQRDEDGRQDADADRQGPRARRDDRGLPPVDDGPADGSGAARHAGAAAPHGGRTPMPTARAASAPAAPASAAVRGGSAGMSGGARTAVYLRLMTGLLMGRAPPDMPALPPLTAAEAGAAPRPP
jgi:hypothetical protein